MKRKLIFYEFRLTPDQNYWCVIFTGKSNKDPSAITFQIGKKDFKLHMVGALWSGVVGYKKKVFLLRNKLGINCNGKLYD